MHTTDTTRGGDGRAGRKRLSRRRIENVLVVRKTTCYMDMLNSKDQQALDLVAAGHSSVAGIKKTHDENELCFQTVDAVLARSGLAYRSIYRQDQTDYNDVDLVITLGGDGSFIDAAHNISSAVPVLGVKSASTSHGHFCLADCRNFELVLADIRSGALAPRQLTRLSMTVDGTRLPLQVVNEVMIGELDLAGTNRYVLSANGRTERQKGTALVLGTAAGSTGLLRSAKGIIQPILARSFQYLPLLPIVEPGERLALPGGLVSPGGQVEVESGMPNGLLHVDGKYLKFPFPRGSRLVVKASEQPLRAYIDPRCHDRYLKHSKKTRR